MTNVDDDYAKFQISASESLRAGAVDILECDERIAFFEEAIFWSRKAFFAANQNVYARVLAFEQYKAAVGLALLAQNDYNSIVLSDDDPENVMREASQKDKP